MKHVSLFRLLVLVSVAVGCLDPAVAVEPSQALVEGLRDRGLYDMAMKYLDQMTRSPLCPPEFKQVIDYESGLTLMAGWRSVRAASVRQQNLSEAHARFKEFITEHPDHPLASGATIQLANVLVERGQMKMDQAARPSKSPEEKKQLMAQARELYTQAKGVFADAQKRFLEKLKTMPTGLIDRKNVKLIEARLQAREDYIQACLFLARVVYEIAMTHPAGSKQRKELIGEAAKKYESLYEKHSSRLAGLYGRMWEGRCYSELGDIKRALQIFDELLAQPDEPPAIRNLKNKVLALALETSIRPQVKQYKQAIEKAQEWEKTSRASEQSSHDGLAIKFLTANAYLEYARRLKANDPLRDNSLTAARKTFQFVTRFPGDYQRQARAKLADPLLSTKGAAGAEPADFSEAHQRAKAALERMQAAEIQDRLDLAEGKTENHQKYMDQIVQARGEAIKCFRTALSMVTLETPTEELNMVRYYLAYLHWHRGDLYEAAVLGEFLARRYPNAAGARQGAKIAMAAYARLFNAAKPDSTSRTFAANRMVAVADYITKRWAEGEVAGEAWMMLIRTAVAGGRLQEALEHLEKVPEDSPRRAEAQLMVGRALWGAYLKAMRREEADRPSQEELDKMVARAQKVLQQGVARMRKSVDAGGQISASLFGSVLSLAQIHVGAGQPNEAIKWLDDPKIGAVTLVKAKHPAATKPGYAVETYKTALRAYVAAEQLDKAEAAMDTLEKLVAEGGDAKAAKRLTQIYVSLGRELEELLERLRKQNKTKELTTVLGGFELFLDRISKREEGNTFNSLNWVAETFFGMGAGSDTGGKTLSADAKKYYEKAVQAYDKILLECEADAKFAPQPDATIGVEVRLARCLRRLGQFKDAMELLVDVLKYRNMMVDAQVEAAYTYQAWGGTKGNARKYDYAIKGGRRAKKKDSSKVNIVWGWGKIAKMVARSPKHIHVFHEARYNLALCRFEYAMTIKERNRRKKALKMAENDIMIIHRLYPRMGGDQWRGKYNSLLKKIQKVRGVKATGLPKSK